MKRKKDFNQLFLFVTLILIVTSVYDSLRGGEFLHTSLILSLIGIRIFKKNIRCYKLLLDILVIGISIQQTANLSLTTLLSIFHINGKTITFNSFITIGLLTILFFFQPFPRIYYMQDKTFLRVLFFATALILLPIIIMRFSMEISHLILVFVIYMVWTVSLLGVYELNDKARNAKWTK